MKIKENKSLIITRQVWKWKNNHDCAQFVVRKMKCEHRVKGLNEMGI